MPCPTTINCIETIAKNLTEIHLWAEVQPKLEDFALDENMDMFMSGLEEAVLHLSSKISGQFLIYGKWVATHGDRLYFVKHNFDNS